MSVCIQFLDNEGQFTPRGDSLLQIAYEILPKTISGVFQIKQYDFHKGCTRFS